MPEDASLARMMPRDALPLGLGCSRLGSINGASGSEADRLLNAALDQGVRFFDTANIYGQGDSERLLAKALGVRDDCLICSKAGKYLPWKKRILVPLKGLMRQVARRSDQARRGVVAARSRPIPERWDVASLTASLEGSLRRLRRDRIEVFLLHSPSAEIVAQGEAVGALEKAQKAGKVGLIGVSVDDVSCAEAALSDPRVQLLQVPLCPGATEFDPVLSQAGERGVSIVAREILGGVNAIARMPDPKAFAMARIAELVRDPRVSVPLVGTTRMANLNVAIEGARAATA